MRLLVVEVLNPVLCVPQKIVSCRQRVCRGCFHQTRLGQARQRVHSGTGTKLGKLPTAHHLQQLHGEFNFTNATARHLHVVGALGVPGAALGSVLANLPVQHAQGVKHAVVKVAPKDERQNRCPQCLCIAALNAVERRNDATFEPSKALPLAAMGLEIVLKCTQGHGRWPRTTVRPECEVHPEHKTVLGYLTDQRVD